MSELNKILGRDFIIAFVLPSLFLLVCSFFCLKAVGIESVWLKFDLADPLKDSTILALETFVLGIFLQSINRELFRLAEGYWNINPRWLTFFQRKKFRWLNREIGILKTEKEECIRLGKTFERQFLYNKLSQWAVTKFPRREDLVLPTSFGNVVRAYEDYPRAVYGFESINGWSRIQALLSKQVTDVLSQTRTRVDMWLNFSFITGLLILEIAFETWKFRTQPFILLLPVCLFFMLFSYVRARSSAIRYGEQVKATFDIYLPQLAEKLGFVLSKNPEKNREFWEAFSQLMVYRDEKAVGEMYTVGLKRKTDKTLDSVDDSSDDEGI